MNRKLSIERVYNLGQYKSLRVVDEIDGIPDELSMNQEFADYIRILQLVNADLVFQNYALKTKELADLHDGTEEKIDALLTIRANTFDDLTKLLNNKE